MNRTLIRRTMAATGAILALAALSLGAFVPSAHADLGLPPGLILPGDTPNVPEIDSQDGGLPQGLTLPGGTPAGPQTNIQNVTTSVMSAFGSQAATEFYYEYDTLVGWGVLRIDYKRYNPATGALLMTAKLYRPSFFGYYLAGAGSGSRKGNELTFAIDFGYHTDYFEAQPFVWGTRHPLGNPLNYDRVWIFPVF